MTAACIDNSPLTCVPAGARRAGDRISEAALGRLLLGRLLLFGEPLEGRIELLVGALHPLGDRDLVGHHRHVVAHEDLLDLLEIRRRRDWHGMRQRLIIEGCARRVGEEAWRLRGGLASRYAASELALLLLSLLTRERPNK